MTDIIARAESFADRFEKLADETGRFAEELKPHITAWNEFVVDFGKRYGDDTGVSFPWRATPFRNYPISQAKWDEAISWESYDGSNITFVGQDYEYEPVSWDLPLNFVDDPEGYKAKAEVEWRESAAKYFTQLKEEDLKRKEREVARLQEQIKKLQG